LGLGALESVTPLHPAEELASGTSGRKLVGAEETGPAARGERAHHPVALAEACDVPAELHDLPDEFVAHDGAGIEAGLAAVPDVEVGAADGGEADQDDGVGGLAKDGIGHPLDPEV